MPIEVIVIYCILFNCISYQKQKVAALAILLVGLSTYTAHDIVPNEYTEGWSNTKSTTKKPTEKSSKRDVKSNQSVVVDWLLVCEDLCG